MNIIDRTLSLLAPNLCVSCHVEGVVLCDDCSALLVNVPSQCYVCMRATRYFRPCQTCVTQASPEYVWMSTFYDGLGKKVEAAYKFDNQRSAARSISLAMDEVMPYFAQPPIVTYVPTSSRHVRQRGFDHAKLIAQNLGRIRKFPVATLLARNNTVQQHGATRSDRTTQLKGAFRTVNTHLIEGADILLADDVLTTGATVEACTKALRVAGARSVSAVVFARTPK